MSIDIEVNKTERPDPQSHAIHLPHVPGLFEVLIELQESKVSSDEKISRASTALKETSQIIGELEADLIDRTENLVRLREEYDRFSELASIEEEKAKPLAELFREEIATSLKKNAHRERLISVLIGLSTGIIVFFISHWINITFFS